MTGVENNSIALEICKKKNLKVYDSIENLPHELFDIVSLWHVLEHLPQPNKIIEKIYDLLSSEGVLVIAVPNFPVMIVNITRISGQHLMFRDIYGTLHRWLGGNAI